MERLEGFVAGALRQRLHRAGVDDRVAVSTSFRGAVLFVDISGYSALAETLCAQGADGLETLGMILDHAFRDCVSVVHDSDGEIACFAGDAFIAYWPADDANVSRALHRAHDCARRLHTSSRFDVHPAAVVPALHIGAGAGEIWAARLGSDEGWQLLLAGTAVRGACAACGKAAAGETVVAPAAGPYAVPSPDLPSPANTGDNNDDDAAAAVPVLLAAHVPRRIQEYADKGYSEWIPQRRTICALFIRIDGLDETAPDALKRHQAVVTSLQIALRLFTNSLGTLLLDDKGLVFTLCLGMPHDSHADDALRAVRAGLAVRAELLRLGVGCAIGVAAGDGVCMPIGSLERRHYWAVGRFMHVAGRLMSAAGDGILCTEEVADRVRRIVSLSPERPLVLKGMRWPLRAFRVLEGGPADDETDVLYGRDDEQASLEQYFNRFESGRGTVLWMVGEAGLGKTALVQYLKHVARQRATPCLVGGAGSIEIDVPYSSWRPIFAELLRDPSGAALSQSERQLRLGYLRHPQLASLVNAVVPGFLEETPMARSLSGQARADATASVLSEVISASVKNRFVLVLEDCHWMDSASWRLLLRVSQDYRESLIVLTSRPGGEVEELGSLRTLEGFAELKLAPLRTAAIEALVQRVLGGHVANQEMIDEIAERASGNPLFAREYALLLTAHAFQRDFGTGVVASQRTGKDETVPVTVQSLIAGRLDGLSPSQDLALKAASVIGDRFSLALLAGVYPGHPHEESLELILKQLTEQQLVMRDERAEPTFAFTHALIREVTYRQLTGEQKHRLHARVAEYLEREHSADLRPYLAALAHHWSQAEAWGPAIRYADQAASQALAAGAFEAADRLLSLCIQRSKGEGGVGGHSDTIRWHRQVADARHGMGQLEARLAAAHQALRLAGRRRARGKAGLVVQAFSHLCAWHIHQLFPRLRRTGDAAELLDIARAYRHSAEVCYFDNDMLGTICDSISAVSCASSLPPSAVLADASSLLGGILSIAGLRKTGERLRQSGLAVAEAAGDRSAQAHAHMVSCLYFVGLGDWRSAERSAERSQALSEPMDDRVNWTNAQAVRFWMSHYRSHEAAAYDAARNLHDRATETGSRQHRAWGYRFLALCALRTDKPREAIAQLQAALECLGETAAHNERVSTLGVLALAQLKSGDIWSARATAKEGLGQIVRPRRPIGHSTLEGYSSLVAVALDAWNEERSSQWKHAITSCLGVLSRYRKSFPVGEPRYQLHRGDYLRMSGWPAAARRCYRRGEAAATRLGMPWEAARCREALESSATSSPR